MGARRKGIGATETEDFGGLNMTQNEYQEEIDRFIPEAWKHANAAVKKRDFDNSQAFGQAWNYVFHGEMDEKTAHLRKKHRI